MLYHKPFYNQLAYKFLCGKCGMWNFMKKVSVHFVELEILSQEIILQMKNSEAKQICKIYIFHWDLLENGHLLVVD